eukprot:PhM_4_TR16374/c0_g1_i2/m.77388/K18163/NDUFAF6; NADH dehydrogenase [ubiquinone] 1 alpha subcomplex assembly factor 6
MHRLATGSLVRSTTTRHIVQSVPISNLILTHTQVRHHGGFDMKSVSGVPPLPGTQPDLMGFMDESIDERAFPLKGVPDGSLPCDTGAVKPPKMPATAAAPKKMKIVTPDAAPEEPVITRPLAHPMDAVDDQTQEEIWTRMSQRLKQRKVESAQAETDMSKPHIVDYYKAEANVKEEDRFHWRLATYMFDDFDMRLQYFALYSLMLSLNKAKWVMIDVSSKKQSGKLGAGIRQAFWQESLSSIIENSSMPHGEFVDGHPTLRTFAQMHKHHKFTKHFARNFVNARLKLPFQQPGNVRQLADYYEKAYSNFFHMMLEMLGIRGDTVAEHVASHIGKAVGITQQSVLLWRHYARKGICMLPADVCSEYNVNYSLVCNLALSTHDSGVKRVLFDLMGTVREELKQAREMIHDFPAAGWPILMETLLPNYYIQFLLKHDFDVTKWFSEDFIYTPGFYWYAMKKMSAWSRNHDFVALLEEDASFF